MATPHPINAKEWYTGILPSSAKRALDFLAGEEWLGESRWYLAGGTALALQEGHRQSLDLDFFIPDASFNSAALLERMPEKHWKTNVLQDGTIYGTLFDAKVSFIAYPFFKSNLDAKRYGHVRILQSTDIAVMKILAISQRGRKRDFVDLYWYVTHHEPLAEILCRLPEQYPTVAHNYHHIYKTLVYFEDAEEDPMPQLNFDTSWTTIKNYFLAEAPKATRPFLEE